MARLIPDELDDVELADFGRKAERETLLRLRDELPDDFSVYHAVHWAHAERAGSVYGEIDFIVANRYGTLLAIEQNLPRSMLPIMICGSITQLKKANRFRCSSPAT